VKVQIPPKKNEFAPAYTLLSSLDGMVILMESSRSTKLEMDRFLHHVSQYSFENGESSCTYISIEACIQFLQTNKVEYYYMNKEYSELSKLIEEILACGVAIDEGLGVRACDETISSNERLRSLLNIEKFFIGKLKNELTYKQLLREMEVIARSSANREKKVCCILTKPPQTISIAHILNKSLPFEFFVFDSHPRSSMNKLEQQGIFQPGGNKGPGTGAGFYFFKDIHTIEKFLKVILPDQSDIVFNDDYVRYAHSMFEATIVSLKHPNEGKQAQEKTLSTQEESLTNSQQLKGITNQPLIETQLAQEEAQKNYEQLQQLQVTVDIPVLSNDENLLNVSNSADILSGSTYSDISNSNNEAIPAMQSDSTDSASSMNNSNISECNLKLENQKYIEENESLKRKVQELQNQLDSYIQLNENQKSSIVQLRLELRRMQDENKSLIMLLKEQKANYF